MNNNIVLIGYMGAGKTTVGHILAKNQNMAFADTDDIISENEKCTVNDIFACQGEQYFRELETALLKEMCENTENTVISCGGGMPIREINRTYLKKLGSVIYLSVSEEVVYKRLKGDTTRPLLRGDESEVKLKISEMINSRKAFYEAAADYIITINAEESAEATAELILNKLRR